MQEKLINILHDIILDNYNIDLENINLEIPPKKELGDFAFGCFILSKELKKNPAQIASELSEILTSYNLIESVSSAGPYLNIKLSKNIHTDLFNSLYKKKSDIIGTEKLNKKTIVIDYIGANVGKPLHIGHMCTPNQGQVLVNIYRKLGYNVITDSHIGDWGIIFGKLILAYKMWGEENMLKTDAVNHLFELYVKITKEADKKGEEIEQKTRDEFKLLSKGDINSIELWNEFTRYSIDAMNIQLDRLNIKTDFNIGESFYEGLGLPKMENYPDLKHDMHTIVEELIGLGIATKNDDNSVGVVFDDILNITSCILQKRDGTHGYLASDLAAIRYRMENWNPEKILYFVDARQKLHLQQAFTIAQKAGWTNDTELFHAYNGFISLKDGAMSTRKGKIIKLDLLLDEAESRAKKIILEKRDDIIGEELDDLSKIIGIGAIKYGYLKKNREIDVIFDWDEFMSFEGNSGPYIQYAYVRSIRILEKSGKIDKELKGNFNYSEEIELIKILSKYNDVLKNTAQKKSPHILCKYSYALTKIFNSFYNNVHILSEEDINKKMMRLKLVELFSEVIKDSFKMLGIKMPIKM